MDQLSDTPQRIEQFQIFLLRNATVARRFSRARSLSQTAMELSRRAIARSHPSLTDDELKGQIVEYFYGKPLASRLQEYLARKKK